MPILIINVCLITDATFLTFRVIMIDAITLFLRIWLFISFGLFIYIMLVLYYIFKPPKNNPKRYLKKLKKKKTLGTKPFVLIGDSLTHGTICFNYGKRVKKRIQDIDSDVTMINAGINGDTTYNTLRRLDDVIKCQPDVITIMIGTNDTLGIFYPENRKAYYWQKKAPKEEPDFWTVERYERDLKKILNRIKEETKARVALLSIPIIGEDPDDLAFKSSIQMSSFIERVAREEQVHYLPVNEAFREELKLNKKEKPRKYNTSMGLMILSGILHYFGLSWNKISKRFGFELMTDAVHINDKGASLIANLILDYYQGIKGKKE